MSFTKGLKIGLALIILGLAALHAGRTLTLCGGVLQTAAPQPPTSLSAPAAEQSASPPTGTPPLND